MSSHDVAREKAGTRRRAISLVSQTGHVMASSVPYFVQDFRVFIFIKQTYFSLFSFTHALDGSENQSEIRLTSLKNKL